MPLNDTQIRQFKFTGKTSGDKLSDGGGLFLHVKAAGKYWKMSYRFAAKQKTILFGVYPDISLAKARKKRDEAREQLADGNDPSVLKRKAKLAMAAQTNNTFEKVAEKWLKSTEKERKPITQSKLSNWLNKDINPFIGKLTITDIGPRDVLNVARKVEQRGALDTAKRVLRICSHVFCYAIAEGSADRDVTTGLTVALKKPEKKHYAAITNPIALAPLLRAIEGYEGHPSVTTALRLTPLVFLRPGELRQGEWTEVNFENAEWRIPASRMKMVNDHIVPLSTQAIEILREAYQHSGHGRFIFPNIRTGERCISENTVNASLRAIGYDGKTQTAHGFRATARTILDEVLGERVDLIEHQLAHAVKDANGRAYNRTAHLPARRKMMQTWADYLDKLKAGADVIPFKSVGQR